MNMKYLALILLLTACALDPLDPCARQPGVPSSWSPLGGGPYHPIGGVVSVAIVGTTSPTCVTNDVTIEDDLNGKFKCDLFLNGYSVCAVAQAPVCAGVLYPSDGSPTVGACVFF